MEGREVEVMRQVGGGEVYARGSAVCCVNDIECSLRWIGVRGG